MADATRGSRGVSRGRSDVRCDRATCPATASSPPPNRAGERKSAALYIAAYHIYIYIYIYIYKYLNDAFFSRLTRAEWKDPLAVASRPATQVAFMISAIRESQHRRGDGSRRAPGMHDDVNPCRTVQSVPDKSHIYDAPGHYDGTFNPSSSTSRRLNARR
jgi:hypothetical protein